jgi:hypothetical protein
MSASDWIQIVLLAAILGAVGQGIRFAIGSAGPGNGDVTVTSASTALVTSLLVGAVAGVSAAAVENLHAAHVTQHTIVALIVAGYAGTDVIDQFIARTGVANGRVLPQDPPRGRVDAG